MRGCLLLYVDILMAFGLPKRKFSEPKLGIFWGKNLAIFESLFFLPVGHIIPSGSSFMLRLSRSQKLLKTATLQDTLVQVVPDAHKNVSNMRTIGASPKLKTLTTSRYGKTLPQIFDTGTHFWLGRHFSKAHCATVFGPRPKQFD